jgi:GAF domain-containing protein
MNQDRESREARLGRTLVELADTLVEDFEVLDFLYLLCERCVQVLAVDAVGVLLANREGVLELSAASSEEMRLLELFELQNEEGPCYDAFVNGTMVARIDLRGAEERWPSFAPRALEAGFRSVYGFPLRLRGDVIGALNMFRKEPGAFDGPEVLAGRAMADVATIGIMQERIVRESRLRTEQLQRALDSRVIIEQAKGTLAERLDVTPADAFERLRAHARSHRRAITDVAREVVEADRVID